MAGDPTGWKNVTVCWYESRRCGTIPAMTAYAVIIIEGRAG
jgi:hypothetical protein